MRDPGYKTICDRCSQGTWYDSERPCTRYYFAHCPTCGQTIDKTKPCGGTLRVIDHSDLAAAFRPYYTSGRRIKVRMADGEELTGTVSRTTGWRPSYMLMRRSSDSGSSYLLSDKDIPIATLVGRKYIQTYYPMVTDGTMK